MRTVFGLVARTEVLRSLLFSDEKATATELALKTNYAKRNVAEACEMLARAGVLSSTAVGNRLYFSMSSE
jgi:DNA-binding IclR family transcriptional regulator